MSNANLFADLIIDISHEAVDRPFQYIVPDSMKDIIAEGMEVKVPFGKGNTLRKAYVVAISQKPSWPIEKMKVIDSINNKAIGIEGKTLELAAWMKKRYGSTMILAMQTVLPVKKRVRENCYKTINCLATNEELTNLIAKCNSYMNAGRKKLLTNLLNVKSLPYSMVTDKLNVSDSVIKTLEKNKIIEIERNREYRIPQVYSGYKHKEIILSDEQKLAINTIKADMDTDTAHTELLYGVTGSGKTEVYMELISYAISKGQQAIVLIPEIALSFQTLMRFYDRFGNRVSVMHSKLSEGEKYDQYERAKTGKLDVIIGPRSALFTPFNNLGIIVIDEEHENSYKSEKMPKYHAREVAEHIIKREKATLVLGSATPSIESFYKAKNHEYRLVELKHRNANAKLPKVSLVDMRMELKNGNRSCFSEELKEKLTECIANGHQAMLFINRRGFAGFISCRDCGYVMKCPHCDVALSYHVNTKSENGLWNRQENMLCHYCGYSEPIKKICPKCGSKYFSGFKAGTEKIEEALKKEYPSIVSLRMDGDTAKTKEDYDRILSTFAERKADVLIGTQMIVKGHDFPYVTLVGVIAADISLYAQDYRASERTFQLITQASGRAGRANLPGNVVIQTYRPEEYSLKHAMNQDYDSFYEEELLYRSISAYPPVGHMLAIQFFSKEEDEVKDNSSKIAAVIRNSSLAGSLMIMGPSPAIISRINDIYRYVIYVKSNAMDKLIEIKDLIENIKIDSKKLIIQFDFDPAQSF